MKRVTITLDDYTLKVVDALSERYTLDRSTTIRMLIMLVMKMAEDERERGEDGIQASFGADSE